MSRERYSEEGSRQAGDHRRNERRGRCPRSGATPTSRAAGRSRRPGASKPEGDGRLAGKPVQVERMSEILKKTVSYFSRDEI